MDRHPEIPSFTLKDLRAFMAMQLHADGADATTAQAVLRHYRAAQMDLMRSATVDLGRRIDQRP